MFRTGAPPVQLTGLSGGLSEGPTAKSEPRVTGCTGALPPVYPVLYAGKPQRLLTAQWTWWAIYMPSPGHFKVAGVTTSLTHTQEYLQVIQVLIDHIFSP